MLRWPRGRELKSKLEVQVQFAQVQIHVELLYLPQVPAAITAWKVYPMRKKGVPTDFVLQVGKKRHFLVKIQILKKALPHTSSTQCANRNCEADFGRPGQVATRPLCGFFPHSEGKSAAGWARSFLVACAIDALGSRAICWQGQPMWTRPLWASRFPHRVP